MGTISYTVFKPFAANPILWTRPTQDTSMVTGSSVFDFEHDGKAEVVYGDECYTRVYDGTVGTTLFEAPNPSCTVHETPVIADVDKDGRADDVRALMAHVRDVVSEQSGVVLRAEVRLLGFGGGNNGPVEGDDAP